MKTKQIPAEAEDLIQEMAIRIFILLLTLKHGQNTERFPTIRAIQQYLFIIQISSAGFLIQI